VSMVVCRMVGFIWHNKVPFVGKIPDSTRMRLFPLIFRRSLPKQAKIDTRSLIEFNQSVPSTGTQFVTLDIPYICHFTLVHTSDGNGGFDKRLFHCSKSDQQFPYHLEPDL